MKIKEGKRRNVIFLLTVIQCIREINVSPFNRKTLQFLLNEIRKQRFKEEYTVMLWHIRNDNADE